ncbi:MAG: trigger factor [Gammaproteobacteria bacterium]
MQVSVEKTSELSRKMTVHLPEEQIQEKMEARFKTLGREVKLDGFRPGKTPPHILKRMFGERVRSEVTGDLIESSYYEALKEQRLNPVSRPHIQPAEETSTPGFTYVAQFEVYPEISLDGISQLAIKRPQATVEDTDVEAMISRLREQKKTWHSAERRSQPGDKVTIHFSGNAEGDNFTNGKIENYPVEIGSNQMIPGFEENLTGLQAGDSKTFELTFPETYGNDKLAGKQAIFEIEVLGVEAPQLPEIDADFIMNYGIENGDAEAFRNDVRDNMQRELQQALLTHLKNSVLDALYDNVQVALPTVMVDEEIETLMKPYQEAARKRKTQPQELELPRDFFEEQAKKRVALGLILSEIIQKNSLKVDENRVRTTIGNMSLNYERPEDVINWYYADEKRLNDVRQMTLENQAIDWILEQVQVDEQAMTFNEAMNQNK